MNERILLVANSGFTILNFRSEFISCLVESGYEVYVACPSCCNLLIDRDLTQELSLLGARHVKIDLTRNGLNPLTELKNLYSIYRAIMEVGPSIVVNYTIKPTIYGSVAARVAGVRSIFSNITGVGYIFTSSSIKIQIISIIVKLQYKVALKFNRKVFFQNPDDRDLFVKLGLVRHDLTVLINGSGVDCSKFVRTNFKIKDCSFIFIGRLLKDKGILEYLEAAAILKVKYPNVVFSVVGSFDADNPECISFDLLDYYTSNSIVNYFGTTADVIPYLNSHNIFVFPSYREGTPRSVLEAMSMSMPIITTDAPGCRETVLPNVNGLLTNVADSSGLVSAMESFVLEPSKISPYGEKSRELALKKYDVDSINLQVLDEIADSGF